MIFNCSSIASALPPLDLSPVQMSQHELVQLWSSCKADCFNSLIQNPLSALEIIKNVKIILSEADAKNAPLLLSYLELIPGLRECAKKDIVFFIFRVYLSQNEQYCLIPLLKNTTSVKQ